MSIFNGTGNYFDGLETDQLTVSSDQDQVILGDNVPTTIDCVTTTNRKLTIPDTTGDASFVLDDGSAINIIAQKSDNLYVKPFELFNGKYRLLASDDADGTSDYVDGYNSTNLYAETFLGETTLFLYSVKPLGNSGYVATFEKPFDYGYFNNISSYNWFAEYIQERVGGGIKTDTLYPVLPGTQSVGKSGSPYLTMYANNFYGTFNGAVVGNADSATQIYVTAETSGIYRLALTDNTGSGNADIHNELNLLYNASSQTMNLPSLDATSISASTISATTYFNLPDPFYNDLQNAYDNTGVGKIIDVSNGAIHIQSTGSTGLIVDDEIQSGTVTSVNGTFTNFVLIQPGSDSATVFDVKTSGGTLLMRVNTLSPLISFSCSIYTDNILPASNNTWSLGLNNLYYKELWINNIICKTNVNGEAINIKNTTSQSLFKVDTSTSLITIDNCGLFVEDGNDVEVDSYLPDQRVFKVTGEQVYIQGDVNQNKFFVDSFTYGAKMFNCDTQNNRITTSTSATLGYSGGRFGDVYSSLGDFSQLRAVGSGNANKFYVEDATTANVINVNTSFNRFETSTVAGIGTFSARFGSVYAGLIDGTSLNIASGDSNVYKLITQGNIEPYSDNAYDIGVSFGYYKTAYINEVKTADITAKTNPSLQINGTLNMFNYLGSDYGYNQEVFRINMADGRDWGIWSYNTGNLLFNSESNGKSVYFSQTSNKTNPAVQIFTNSTTTSQYVQTRLLRPFVDNAYSCGTASLRWTAIYAVNGTIQTSDENDKTEIEDSSLGLDFVNSIQVKKYKWKEEKNNKQGKKEYGVISQQVLQCLPVNSDFGGIVHEPEHIEMEDDGEGNITEKVVSEYYGVKPMAFISVLIKAIQEQQIMINDLKTRLEILEN